MNGVTVTVWLKQFSLCIVKPATSNYKYILMIYDVLIIGAGPAGLSAAIYTGRNRLKTLVVSKDLGGQTAVSGEIANYPGTRMTSGVELAQSMLDHALSEKSVKAILAQNTKSAIF